MKILGFDPGTTRVGYGLIEGIRSPRYLGCGVFEIEAKSQADRLHEIDTRTRALLLETKPDAVAIEKLFFAKNRKTALQVSEARGVLLAAIVGLRFPIYEYTPREVKLSVCGYGFADKQAVKKMVAVILKPPALHKLDDAIDALAIALTAAQHLTRQVK